MSVSQDAGKGRLRRVRTLLWDQMTRVEYRGSLTAMDLSSRTRRTGR